LRAGVGEFDAIGREEAAIDETELADNDNLRSNDGRFRSNGGNVSSASGNGQAAVNCTPPGDRSLPSGISPTAIGSECS
jgi:hypothetical protein